MKLSKAETQILKYITHYPEWINEVNYLADMRVAITYDSDKVLTSPNGDVVLDTAIRIEAAQDKIDKVEKALRRVYVTDGAVSSARRLFCYGDDIEIINRRTHYIQRRRFAEELVGLFGKEK